MRITWWMFTIGLTMFVLGLCALVMPPVLTLVSAYVATLSWFGVATAITIAGFLLVAFALAIEFVG